MMYVPRHIFYPLYFLFEDLKHIHAHQLFNDVLKLFAVRRDERKASATTQSAKDILFLWQKCQEQTQLTISESSYVTENSGFKNKINSHDIDVLVYI